MQVQGKQSEDEAIQELQCQIQALQQANLALQEQLASREQYAAMIAHELRGPLTPIINYAQLMARPSQGPESIQRGSAIIVSQAHRLVRIVNDLLDASRISAGQFSLVRQPCDIVALTQELIDQIRPVAPYHTFIADVPEAAVSGNWDSMRLQQALGNLLDNAVKYSDEHTTITISLNVTVDAVHISVHNDGVSIPSTEVGQLFRPYARLQSASTGTQRGSGLGLYITKCIIEAHGGSLRLEPRSSEELQGTTFSFDLPL
jgi:signal transduction histidine kinase